MESNKIQGVRFLASIGMLVVITAMLAIVVEILVRIFFQLSHSIFDVIPSPLTFDDDEHLLMLGVPLLLASSIILFLVGSMSNVATGHKGWAILASISLVPAVLAANASALFGGGWLVGLVGVDVGTCILLVAMVRARKVRLGAPGEAAFKVPATRARKKAKAIVAASLVAVVVVLATVPLSVRVASIPPSLVPAASSKPTGVVPGHQNTFYILPIWEENPWNYTEAVGKINYLKEAVGGEAYTGNGFVKIGWSMSCWYTNNLHANGSYDPAPIIRALNLSANTNTPILFHMNGGNWGQHWSTHANITALRANVSNTQWDQKNVSHPSMQRPGPNDRFWSFWPGSDWELFREGRIKEALAVIKNWSDAHPGLLVGFSTDSEIHLNNRDFHDVNPGGYKSYFDYNPGTIQQYREWAQANWSLEAFNQKCGTSFSSWALVDAPRDGGIVGVIGNPWWETWTDFRIWHVKAAGERQCRWINESGFPRDMIWHHQILSEPNDTGSRYQRCDPLETAVNNYCRVGVTRYDWISPETWNSLGELALNDGSGDAIPSWGIFEWNLWTQHEYWAYREMLNCIYQYGGHVICPNEWTNCSVNEGLWIPGDPPLLDEGVAVNGSEHDPEDLCPVWQCTDWDEYGTCNASKVKYYLRHGNPHFLHALRDFVAKAQDYERGTCPGLRVSPLDVVYYSDQHETYKMFNDEPGIYFWIAAGLATYVFFFISLGAGGKKQKRKQTD